MANMMKRLTAMVLALILIVGQVALPVIADDSAATPPPAADPAPAPAPETHDAVEAMVEAQMDQMSDNQSAQSAGTVAEVYNGPVQEQIEVPGQGTQEVLSNTTATVTVDSITIDNKVADPSATGEIVVPEHVTEEIPGEGPIMYDADGKVITAAPEAVKGEVDEGSWKAVDDGVEDAETDKGDWEKVNGGQKEEFFVSGTYEVVNNQLTADVTDQILIQTGLFNAEELTAYHTDNPTTDIGTLKTLLTNKMNALNELPENKAAGITYVFPEPVFNAETGEYEIVIQVFTLTDEAEDAEFKDAGKGVENIVPGEFGDTPVETRYFGIPEFDFAEGDTLNTPPAGEDGEAAATPGVTSYTKTSTTGTVPTEGSTEDYSYSTTTQDIQRTEQEGKNVVYDIKVTTIENSQTTRTLQEALDAGIITEKSYELVDENGDPVVDADGNPIVDTEGNPIVIPGTDDFVAAKNEELAKLTNTTSYYTLDVTSGLTGSAPTDSGDTVLIPSLNEVDENGKLTGKVKENVLLPVLTATGVNADGYTTNETYTPATLDGNLVYQRVAVWTDADGVIHNQVDYIYGELKNVRESYEFVPNDDKTTGSVVTRTSVTTVQTKHVDSGVKEEDFERKSTGTKEYEGTSVGELCEYSFKAGADGRVLFEMNGETYQLADQSDITYELLEHESDTWTYSHYDLTGFEMKGTYGGLLRTFYIKSVDEDGTEHTRRVYCIEKGVSIKSGSVYTATEGNEGTTDIKPTAEVLDQITTVAKNGYWEDKEGSLATCENTLRNYMNKLNAQLAAGAEMPVWAEKALAEIDSASYSNRSDFVYTNEEGKEQFHVETVVAWLTKAWVDTNDEGNKADGAIAATQWAMWELTYNNDLSNHRLYNAGTKYTTDFSVEALKVALVDLARTAPVEAVTAATGEITGATLKNEETVTIINRDEDGNETSREEKTGYQADMLFKLDVQPSTLSDNVKITVTGMNGAKSEFYLQMEEDAKTPGKKLMSWIGGGLSELTGAQIVREDDQGNFKLTGIQVADGVTISLNLTGIQNMGEGIVIYNNSTYQDFISLSNKQNNMNLTMSMTFGTPEGMTVAEKGSAKRVDTKDVAVEKIDTRTDKTSYYTVTSDPGQKTTETSSQVIVNGNIEKMTITSNLIKEFDPIDYTFKVTTIDDEDGGPDGGIPMLLNLDIPDEPVPMVHEPGEGLVILDEGVPLADAPATGDASLVWAAMSMMSMGGYVFLGKKEKKVRKGGKFLKN